MSLDELLLEANKDNIKDESKAFMSHTPYAVRQIYSSHYLFIVNKSMIIIFIIISRHA
ncbi:hypothetical protein AEAC466_09310 [Asticcacaulis sp. AC466]|nr:hypothetical protein AEAC466_09310 [Asticcacaulis sp. AC466]